jgi:hypothetical protein
MPPQTKVRVEDRDLLSHPGNLGAVYRQLARLIRRLAACGGTVWQKTAPATAGAEQFLYDRAVGEAVCNDTGLISFSRPILPAGWRPVSLQKGRPRSLRCGSRGSKHSRQ